VCYCYCSDSVFNGPPARQPLEDRRPQSAANARRSGERNRTRSDYDKVAVVRNPDKSITMSLAMPIDEVRSSESAVIIKAASNA